MYQNFLFYLFFKYPPPSTNTFLQAFSVDESQMPQMPIILLTESKDIIF